MKLSRLLTFTWLSANPSRTVPQAFVHEREGACSNLRLSSLVAINCRHVVIDHRTPDCHSTQTNQWLARCGLKGHREQQRQKPIH
jgi:hypothetical protein